MPKVRVISSDNHVIEPPDFWTSRIEPKFRDQAPIVVREEDGDWWYCEGNRIVGLGIGAQPGMRFEDQTKLSQSGLYEDVRLGAFDPDEHIKDMELDGIDGGVVFPTIAFMSYNVVQDSELLTAIFTSYNDWLGEFCQPYPDRLKGIGILNVDDVQVGVKELKRCAKLGLAGGMIPVYPPAGKRYSSPEYEPLWATAQDLGMPIHLHLATNRPGPGQEFQKVDKSTQAFVTNTDYWIRMSLCDIIFSGVLEHYPQLRIGSIEMELGWIPHFLERIDYTYTQRAMRPDWHRFDEDMLPSDYVHRQVFFGFQEDGLGVRLRDLIGVDNLMWGSDYPHRESTFPRSKQILAEILEGCTEEEKAKISGGNAAKVYNFN